MTAVNRDAEASFDWTDPLRLEGPLTEDEILLRDMHDGIGIRDAQTGLQAFA